MVNTTFLNYPYNVKLNTFTGNFKAVHASASSNLDVVNNDFIENTFGVSIMGGESLIENNYFYKNSLGVDLQSIGDNDNYVDCNMFSDNSYGVNPSGISRGMKYRANQNDVKDNKNADMIIQRTFPDDGNKAEVSTFGTAAFPTMNTWSQNNWDKNIQANPDDVKKFTYYAHNSGHLVPQCYIGDTDCQDKINNFTLLSKKTILKNYSCGTIGVYKLPGSADPGPTTTLQDDVKNGHYDFERRNDPPVITEIKAELTLKGIDEVLGGAVGRKLMNISKYFVAEEMYDELDSYLVQFGDRVLHLRYSVAVNQHNYLKASGFLDSLEAKGASEDYILPQRVYLNWVQTGITPLEEDFQLKLMAMAEKDSPISAYSRSVLGILYDQRFEPSLPRVDGLGMNNYRTSNYTIANTELLMAPNPFNVEVVVNTSNYENGKFAIYDVLGTVIYKVDIDAQKEIHVDTQTWKPGVYFMYISNMAGETRFEKMVKN